MSKESPQNVRVLIADDIFAYRLGVRGALSFLKWVIITGEADSAEKAVELALEGSADVVIMDLDWYGTKTPGLEAIREMKKKRPEVRIVVVTAFPEYSDDAIIAGADVAVSKQAFNNSDFLAERIKEALAKESRSPSPISNKEDGLSEREIEVLKWMACGLSDVEIGKKLFISDHTVGTHRKSIFGKLHVPNAPAAVAVAVIKGLIRKEDLNALT